jgi:hypothetical protein
LELRGSCPLIPDPGRGHLVPRPGHSCSPLRLIFPE